MKKASILLLFLVLSIISFSQKESERETLLSATSKLLLFHNSAQNIQTLYEYDVREFESIKQKEIATLEQVLLCLNSDISKFLKEFPQSKHLQPLVGDYEAARSILLAFKSKNWKSQEESYKWQLLIKLLKMDLEDFVGCK